MALSLADIESKLREFCAQRHKGWLKNTNPDTVVQYVHDTMLGRTPSRAAIIDNAFVLCTVGKPWWADKPIVQEELLFSLDGEPINTGQVVRYLEALAKAEGAAGVAIGTSLSERDLALSRLLRVVEYHEEARLLYKEITA
jgi:hypothetical protein